MNALLPSIFFLIFHKLTFKTQPQGIHLYGSQGYNKVCRIYIV